MFLLLKASDSTAHDLCHAFDACSAPPPPAEAPAPLLVLQRWQEVKPSAEFRCFVRGDAGLVAACQRHTAAYFPFLAGDAPALALQLLRFHESTVAGVFPLTDCAHRLSSRARSVRS